MNSLQLYIDKIIEKTKDYNQLEKVRYVYIELGKIMSFDLDFSFGNTKSKLKIYNDCKKNLVHLQNYFENQIIICKSLSYLLEYILKKLAIKTETIVEKSEQVKYQHVWNLITLNNGLTFKVDLQSDLQNIQGHLRTKYFGLHADTNIEIISPEKIEKLDKKIGYIKEDNYYTNDYIYLIMTALQNNIPIDKKIDLILQNIDAYCDNKKMRYAERRWYYYEFIFSLLTDKETNKVHFIDAYKNKNEYTVCVVVDMLFGEDKVYLFNNENQKFLGMNLQQLALEINNGLTITSGIKGLRKYLKKIN